MNLPAPFLAAIFDMDGTLVDNMAFHTQALLEVTRRLLGIELAGERASRDFGGVTNADILATIAGSSVPEEMAARWSEEKDIRYRELYHPHLDLIPGARPFLLRLRGAGLGVAIASGAPKVNRDFVLDGLDLRGLFDAVIGQEDARRGKPAPDLFLLAASQLGVDPGRCVVFEDAIHGVQGALAAGMQVVGLTTVCAAGELLEAGARWTLRDFVGLPEGLERELFRSWDGQSS